MISLHKMLPKPAGTQAVGGSGLQFLVSLSKTDDSLSRPTRLPTIFGARGARARYDHNAEEGILHVAVGMWLSLVERCVRDAEVAGSNPVIPTIFFCRALRRGSADRRPQIQSSRPSLFMGRGFEPNLTASFGLQRSPKTG